MDWDRTFRCLQLPISNAVINMTVKDQQLLYNGGVNRCASNESWLFARQLTDSESTSTPGDLVSLAWLQKGDIIQISPLDGEEESGDTFSDSGASLSLPVGDCLGPRHSLMPPTRNICADAVTGEPYSFHFDTSNISTGHPMGITSPGLSKPNYSYTLLIFMAIESTPQKCMTVNQIYNWCENNFPFYKHAGAGWKNSLRHNLSINKSFKRLPRDSRGPGRGAFWTVEPRERPALLDAIKRNPWNFANLTAIVSGQNEVESVPTSVVNPISSTRLFGLGRFGLTQSAPNHFLRTEALTQGTPYDISALSNIPQGALHFVTTTNGQVFATLDNGLQKNSDIDTIDSTMEGVLYPPNQSLPDCRYWLSTDEKSNGILSNTEWSVEDEEQYSMSLKLLHQSERQQLLDLSSMDTTCRSLDKNGDGLDNVHSSDETKLITKQRRKSRLQPTRIVDDTYPRTIGFGFCNECKENAASGCDSCQAKRLRFLCDPLLDSLAKESAVADLINTLDCDQEHGPAGGPGFRRPSCRSRSKRTSDFVADELNGTATDPDCNPEDAQDDANEVYVTPSPFIDHEYAHCQAQLRRPDEIRMVSRFNEAFCAESIRGILKSNPHIKRPEPIVRANFKSENQIDCGNIDHRGEETCSSHDFDGSDSECGEKCFENNSNNHGGRDKPGVRKRGRQKGSGVSRTFSRPVGERTSIPRGRPLSRLISRGRIKRRPSINDASTRRSTRVIKAPKRPYDEFDDSFSIDDKDPELSSNLYDQMHSLQRWGSYDHDGPGAKAFINGRLSMPMSRGCRGKKRGRKRGSFNRSVTNMGYDRVRSDTDDMEPSDSGTDEESYLRLAASRRLPSDAERSVDSQNSDSYPFSTVFLKENAGNNDLKNQRLPKFERKIANVWTRSHWTNNDSFGGDKLESELSHEDLYGADFEEDDVQDYSKTDKHPTVEAAQLLLGISQMRNFRRQSGYLSLDSSGTSIGSTNESTIAGSAQDHVISPTGLLKHTSENGLSASSPIPLH